MNIAVIGAGVSGLRVASLLAKDGHSVTVFDSASEIGGAATTRSIELPSSSGIEHRWVDMGVNDFNAVTYKHLVKLLDELKVPYADLSDSACFYKLDGSVSFTIDPKTNTMPPGMEAEYERFKKEAIEVLKDRKYAKYTVEQYLTEKNYSAEFAAWNIYPRVNGMYFAHDSTPATMPIRGVMHYYSFQEGFGGDLPQRKYFVNGSGSWIQALADHAQNAGVEIQLETPVQVAAGESGVKVSFPKHHDHPYRSFDACVMACHASTCLQILRQGVPQPTTNVLSMFSYTDSVAVAHTYSPVLSPNKNDWRTYNILIHDQFEQLRPYTITYVGNMHQNDMDNPDHAEYNQFDRPYFFLSLNPPVPIPDRYVLKTPGNPSQPVIARFPHNIFNFDALTAQEWIPTIQGKNSLYFCGGWTLGAGLQEECLHSAHIVAEKINGNDVRGHYSTDENSEHFAPHYVRKALGF